MQRNIDRRKSLIFGIVIALAVSAGVPLRAQEEDDRAILVLLPSQRLFPVLTANGAEHGMSVAKRFTTREVWASMGGTMPVVNVAYRGLVTQFTISGTIYSLLHFIPNHIRVLTNDYYVDLNLSFVLDTATVLRFGVGHTSHHLSDDAIELIGIPRSIDYIRDYLQLFVVRDVPLMRGFAYAGVVRHHKFAIPKPGRHVWLFELGAEFLRYRLDPNVETYGSVDVKVREEHSYGTTRSLQLGLRLSGESTQVARVAYTIRSGFDERGQFYDRTITTHTLGCYLDL